MEEIRTMWNEKGTIQLRLDEETPVRLLIPARDGWGMVGVDLDKKEVEELKDLLNDALKLLRR